jgi:hypothetical protein
MVRRLKLSKNEVVAPEEEEEEEGFNVKCLILGPLVTKFGFGRKSFKNSPI